jgi:hypothetical protein
MPRSLQEPEAAPPELYFVSVPDRDVREQSSAPGAEIDSRSSALGKFAMARDEVGVQVDLDDMFDPPPLAGCRLRIDINLPLGIDDRCNALRANRVGCVGQAAEIESLHLHRFHTGSLDDMVSEGRKAARTRSRSPEKTTSATRSSATCPSTCASRFSKSQSFSSSARIRDGSAASLASAMTPISFPPHAVRFT